MINIGGLCRSKSKTISAPHILEIVHIYDHPFGKRSSLRDPVNITLEVGKCL